MLLHVHTSHIQNNTNLSLKSTRADLDIDGPLADDLVAGNIPSMLYDFDIDYDPDEPEKGLLDAEFPKKVKSSIVLLVR